MTRINMYALGCNKYVIDFSKIKICSAVVKCELLKILQTQARNIGPSYNWVSI